MKKILLLLLLVFFINIEKNFAQDTIKFIRVNYHFMLKKDGSGNFNEYWDGRGDSLMNGYERAKRVIEKANFELSRNKKMFRNDGKDRDVPPTSMQYVLCGVYFHRDDALYTPDHYAGGFDMLEIHGVNKKTEINIFNIPDNGNGTGIANNILTPEFGDVELACKVKDYTYYEKFPEWSVMFAAGNLNHEIGHLLGLQHTWNENDGCDDTPMGVLYEGAFRQCWGYKERDPICGSWANVSNNIMDYNEHFPHSYTPCQLNIVHNVLNTAAIKYVAKMDKYAPPIAFFDVLQYNRKVFIDARNCQNTVRSILEVVDMEKSFFNPNGKKVLTIDKNEVLGRLELQDLEANHTYKISLTTFSKMGEKHIYATEIKM